VSGERHHPAQSQVVVVLAVLSLLGLI